MLRVHRLSKKLDECLFRMPVARVLALFWLLALKQLSKRRRVLAALFWPFMSLFLPLLSWPTNEMAATVGRDGDAHGGGERRWGDGSRATTLDALDDT